MKPYHYKYILLISLKIFIPLINLLKLLVFYILRSQIVHYTPNTYLSTYTKKLKYNQRFTKLPFLFVFSLTDYYQSRVKLIRTMAQFVKITELPECLLPLYLTQQTFWNRFYKTSRIEDPFARIYDICDDIFHNNCKVAVKDYGSSTQQQCDNVITNLQFYRNIQNIEGLCKLVAFCQEETTGDIKAAFEYQQYSLEEVLQRRQFQNNSYGLYLLIFRELLTLINHFKAVGITLQELVLSNILLLKKEEKIRLKILYDEREKKYDKIQEGLKTYCSPNKINTALKQIDINPDEQIVFELGLLLLDIMYLYESTSANNLERTNTNSSRPLRTSGSTLFKSYLAFDTYTSCSLNGTLVQAKIQYLNSLSSPFLTEMCSLIDQMISEPSKRPTYLQLEAQHQKLIEVHKKEQMKQINFNIDQEISPIKSKESTVKAQDSLKYSDSRQQINIKKTIQSQTTVPASHGLLDTRNQYQFQSKQHHEFCIIPKQKLLSAHCPAKIKIKLQMFIIELQNKVALNKKNYYDGNVYYGQIDKSTQKRQGLGIYVYHYGDIYFGVWRENSIIQGTYIFKNGDCFQGTVKKGKQGKGTYYYSNGNLYEGSWLDDLKHGQGKMFYSNGDSYEGQWLRGKRNGYGSYFFNNGTIFRGNFMNGKKHGSGTIFFTDGTKVEANWVENHIQGKGKVHYENGDFFEGIFNFSLKQGEGLYCWEDSTKYEGFFKKDMMSGFARIHYGEGQYFEGSIFQGKRQGEGYYKYSNGDQFKGQWKNDQKYSGQYFYHSGGSFEGKFTKGQMSYGVLIYPNGQSYQGEFQNGQRYGLGVYRNASGVILYEGQWSNDSFIPGN